MRYLVLGLLAFSLLGCENKETESGKPNGISHNELKIIDVWARPAGSGSNTAAYLLIENGTTEADTLINAYSEIAEDVQIHESYAAEDGIMGMRRIPNVILEPMTSAVLKPGGKHIMFLGMREGISVGDTLRFELEFARKGRISLQAPVRTPGGM
jgi:hypothetical protein